MNVLDNHTIGTLRRIRLLGPLEQKTRVVQGGNRQNPLHKHLGHGRPSSLGGQQTHKGAQFIDRGLIKERLAPDPFPCPF